MSGYDDYTIYVNEDGKWQNDYPNYKYISTSAPCCPTGVRMLGDSSFSVKIHSCTAVHNYKLLVFNGSIVKTAIINY